MRAVLRLLCFALALGLCVGCPANSGGNTQRTTKSKKKRSAKKRHASHPHRHGAHPHEAHSHHHHSHPHPHLEADDGHHHPF